MPDPSPSSLRRRLGGLWSKAATATGLRPSAGVIRRLLVDQGFLKSGRAHAPVDGDGEPIPWYTYPAIEHLASLDFSGCRVLEYGAGNSTHWWRARADEVISIETDPDWYHQIKPDLEAGRGTLHLVGSLEEYLAVGPDAGTFDVIVVDGLWRRQPAEMAPDLLRPDGMIVLDNSDWLPNTHARLRNLDVVEMNFHGFVPLVHHTGTTSVFLMGDATRWKSTRPPRPVGWKPAPIVFQTHDDGLT